MDVPFIFYSIIPLTPKHCPMIVFKLNVISKARNVNTTFYKIQKLLGWKEIYTNLGRDIMVTKGWVPDPIADSFC